MIGGVCLDGKKDATLLDWTIRRPAPPTKVLIPLHQSTGPAPQPCVHVGSLVRAGEMIAEPRTPQSVALHASLSGKVSAMGVFSHPILGEDEGIEITSDGLDEKVPGVGVERTGWQHLDKDSLLSIFRQSGLVDLDSSMQAVHEKIRGLHSQKAKTLVINACESEPYLTANYVLMMTHTVEILRGVQILQKAADAQRTVIAIEENKLQAAELLRSKIFFLKDVSIEVKVFPTRYPQGAEEILEQEFADKRTSRERDEKSREILVLDVATAFAVYEAVVFQKPLYERALTVGGECVVEARNLWGRIGTSFEDLLRNCRGLLREPGALVMGGPMKGFAQSSPDVSILKGTQAILALPKETVPSDVSEPCIRCGDCLEACPMEISPAMITLASEHGLWDAAADYGISRCIECGLCSYVCPSKRPMQELIRRAKTELVTVQVGKTWE